MTSNPMARDTVYEQAGVISDKPMTITGAINKTAFLLTIVALTSVYTWYLAMTGFMDKVTMFIWGGAIAGLIVAIITTFKPAHSRVLSITYAVCEGLVLGGISAMYESFYNGIVAQAVGLTFISLFSMLALYRMGIIKATEKFRKVMMVAIVSVLVFYLINIIASFFSPAFISIFRSGPIGIGISLIIVAIASLSFVLDFDFIEKGAASYAPKYLEWYGGFMLLVTLIWLYLEMLRLLSMLRER